MKLKESSDNYLHFLCPGCDEPHSIRHGVGSWTWNGNFEKPTFSPSIRVSNNEGTLCHSFIRDGMIEFCTDSPHSLAGQTVELPDWDTKWD
jgi:hypothetical protein